MWNRRNCERGAALLTAVTLLAVFSMLGVSFLAFMSIEEDRVQWRTRTVRAETLAADYLHAAIAEVGGLLARGEAVPVERAFPPVPVYLGGGEGLESLVDSEALRGEVRVRISDEAARVDVNRAAPWLLSAVTGLDLASAEGIRQRVRPPFTPDSGGREPLRSLAELKTRGLLDETAYASLPTDRLTVFSGSGPMLNANSLSVDMLAAALRVDVGKASDLAAQRPFASREALASLLGEGVALPAAVGVGSQCYRIVCSVELTQPTATGAWRPLRTHRFEAVVVFGGEKPRIVQWRLEGVDEEPSSS